MKDYEKEITSIPTISR